MNVILREYEERDFESCEHLWRKLTRRHREIYADPSIGGDDPGLHFEMYLKKTNLHQLWIAQEDSVILGMAGLLVDGDEAEIEPVVVRSGFRSTGIGTRLIEKLKAESKSLGVRYLNIRPVVRNVEAIKCFHRAGFSLLSHLEMFLDLTEENYSDWQDGVTVHGYRFRY